MAVIHRVFNEDLCKLPCLLQQKKEKVSILSGSSSYRSSSVRVTSSRHRIYYMSGANAVEDENAHM